MPRFHPGDRLLCEYPEKIDPSLCTGDVVAAFLALDYRRAVVGRLLAYAADTVVVQPPRGPTIEIPLTRITTFTRVIGCMF